MYVKDSVIKVTRWVNLFAMFWFTNFLFGCQDFIIAGAVSKWFFTRNKSKLNFPALISFGHLIRFHLGSICMGSTIIAVIQFFRVILKWIEVSHKSFIIQFRVLTNNIFSRYSKMQRTKPL